MDNSIGHDFPWDGCSTSITGNEILSSSYLKIGSELKFFELCSKVPVWSITEIVSTLKALNGSMVHLYDDLKCVLETTREH